MEKSNRFIQTSLILLFTLLVFSVVSVKFYLDDDLFWHLKTGKYIIENYSVPSEDVFGFATQGSPWIPFEWGWDICIYIIYSIGGYAGIGIFRAVICTAVFAFSFLLAYRLRANFFHTAVLSLLILFGALSRLLPRPHLISYLFIVIVLYVILGYKYFDKGNFKRLWFLPGIFLVWGNFHMGVSVGILIFTSFFISEFFKTENKLIRKKLLLLVFITLASLLVNPHFIDTYVYAFSHTQMKMLEEINEWKSPFNSALWSYYYSIIYFFFLGLSLLVLRLAKKEKDIFPLLIYIGLLYLSLSSLRFRVDFELAMLPFILISMKGLFENRIKNITPALNVGLAVIIVASIYLSLSNKLYSSILNTKYRETGLSVNEKFYPAGLVRFINENKIYSDSVRFFNSLRSGGFLLWNINGYKNFIDSRNMNDEMYFRYKKIENIKPGFEMEIDKLNLEGFSFSFPYMTVNPTELSRNIVSYLSKNPDKWKLVYWDDKSLLFLKNNDKFANITKSFEYRHLTPFNYFFNSKAILKSYDENREELLAELERKLKEEPQSIIANEIKRKLNINK